MSELDYNDLALSPLLVGLHLEELDALMALAEERHFVAGEVVVEEGSPGDTMFMLKTGVVEVEKQAPSGKAVELAEFQKPGDFFGEMVFVDILPRSATLRTKSPCTLLAFKLESLEQFFRAYQDAHLNITLNIARMLSIRLRKADEEIASLKGHR